MADKTLAPYGATLLRLTLAFEFAVHLQLKLQRGIPQTYDYFVAHGYPGFMAYPDMLGEFVGAIMLLLGVYSRYVCLVLSPILIGSVAIFWPKGWRFSEGGYELPAIWLVLLYVQALLGDGALALKVPPPPWERRQAN